MRYASGRGQIMRKFMWLAGLTLGLVWAGSAQAQTAPTSPLASLFKMKSLNINVMPNITNNNPMDYRNANFPVGGYYQKPNLTGTAFPFRLSSMFFTPTSTNSISATTTFGRSTFPTPAQMQAAAPAYLSAFQMYRPSFVQP